MGPAWWEELLSKVGLPTVLAALIFGRLGALLAELIAVRAELRKLREALVGATKSIPKPGLE